MSATNELSNLIDKMVTEKTFTMDALTAIQEMKGKAEQLEARNTKLDEELTALKDTHRVACRQRDEAYTVVANWTTREQELVKREAKVVEHERKAAVAEAQASAYKDALKTVFAPNVVREHVMTSRSYTNPQGQYISDCGSDTKTTAHGYGDSGNTPPTSL